MGPGTFGYFPEGAAYGPQSSEGRSATAVLQFGGASGGGYLSRQEVEAGREALRKFGSFDGGVFRRNDDGEGRRNTDAYQAIWEHAPMRRNAARIVAGRYLLCRAAQRLSHAFGLRHRA
jgi:hypothetical protein